MWSRAELKGRGRIAFKRNYWKCLLVSLVLMLLFGGSGSSSSGGRKVIDNFSDGFKDGFGSIGYTDHHSNDFSYDFFDDNYDDYDEFFDDDYDYDDFYNDYDDYDLYYDDGSYAGSSHHDEEHYNTDTSFGLADIFSLGIFGVIGAGILFVIAAAAIAINVFICSPIEIGGCRFFIENSSGTPGLGLLFYAFQSGYYGKMVLTLFLKKLYIILWSLLLLIPGIVKSYEYRMVSYLLADNPEFSRQDAFRISKEMMNGQKMDAFVLDLSFIGWNILSAITLGLVGIFYVNPYENATNAELYLELKQQYLSQNSGYTERY